jgi:hypothetical protein
LDSPPGFVIQAEFPPSSGDAAFFFKTGANAHYLRGSFALDVLRPKTYSSHSRMVIVCWFGQRAKVGDEYLPAFLFVASR